jgi:uncharacterized SAM-binding protein YcdF (DUF218 family)
MSASARERFCAMLYNGPRDRADVIVVLCGEDGQERTDMARALFARGAAPRILVTGRLNEPPFRLGALACKASLIEQGVSPDRIDVDDTAMHTRDQAVVIAARAEQHGWRQVILVASAYHLHRAVLTVLVALQECRLAETVRIIPAAPPSKWTGEFSGLPVSRLSRLDDEFRKMEEYVQHVARPSEGIAYLEGWESVHA